MLFVELLFSYHDRLVLAEIALYIHLLNIVNFVLSSHTSRHETIRPQTVWRLNNTEIVNSAQAASFRQRSNKS